LLADGYGHSEESHITKSETGNTDPVLSVPNATGVPNVPTVTNVLKMTKHDSSVSVFGSVHFYMGF